MWNFAIPASFALAAGVSVVVQQVLNNSLRQIIHSAAWTGVASYFVGLLCMLAFTVIVRDPFPAISLSSRMPWWSLTGGLFGGIFIALAILTIPQLGAATFITLLVAGQMLASIAFDHFAWLGLAHRPLDLPRAIGAALLVLSVVLIRR